MRALANERRRFGYRRSDLPPDVWTALSGKIVEVHGCPDRGLTIVDTLNRYAPAIEPWFGFRAADVIEVLEHVGREHGVPQAIRVEQGSKFVSRGLDP